jgi:hypothetical protein
MVGLWPLLLTVSSSFFFHIPAVSGAADSNPPFIKMANQLALPLCLQRIRQT